MYVDKREEDTAVVAVVAHHSTAEREGPPGLAVVAQPHLPRVRARQGWVVVDVERLEGEVISLCGAGGVCVAMKAGLLLAGLRIIFNHRAPLAGFVTPCVAVWDRSGSTRISIFFSRIEFNLHLIGQKMNPQAGISQNYYEISN